MPGFPKSRTKTESKVPVPTDQPTQRTNAGFAYRMIANLCTESNTDPQIAFHPNPNVFGGALATCVQSMEFLPVCKKWQN